MGLSSWFSKKRKSPTVEQGYASRKSKQTAVEQRFTTVKGRKFLKDAPYALPKDMQEINRLDLQHYLLRHIMHKNYVAPIENPISILDVGSGTGRWGIEMAKKFTQAQVIGMDLVEPPADALNNSTVLNYSFINGDILKGLSFPDESFEYVHQRLLFFAIPSSKWLPVVNELVRVTTHGGWVELLEGSTHFRNGGPACQQLADWANEISRRHGGVDLTQGVNIASFLKMTGLTNITSSTIEIPLGEWAGHLGNMASTNVLAGAQALKPIVTSQFGLTEQQFEDAMEALKKEWEAQQSLLIFYYAYGQRP